jgi:hypothetical protein
MQKIGDCYKETIDGITEVEIGDASVVEFKPNLKLKKWGGECAISAELVVPETETAVDSLTPDNKKVECDFSDKLVEFFDLPASDEHPSGGFEFLITLKEKGAPLTVNFTLNLNNVVLYRQPPMAERIGMDGIVSGNETQGFDERGNIIHQCPENIVNSLAIYHANTPLNKVGGINYKSGKIGDIYRPKAIDQRGNETWCEMVLERNILSITVPKEWAEKAEWPIKVDPTFGYNTIGGSSVSGISFPVCHVGSGLIYTAGSRERITQFSVYGSGGGCDAALYTISGGVPVDLLGSATAIDLPASAGWANSAAVSIIMGNGITYGMATGNYTTATLYYDVTTGNQRSAETRAGALQTPWSHANYSAAQYSFYATYETYNEDVV